jgi:hypothetical protein
MKPRYRVFISIGLVLVVIGIVLFTIFSREQEPARSFTGTINLDCGPADGPAFSIFIPHDHGASIFILIAQSPNVEMPRTFRFHDESLSNLYASYMTQFSHSEILTGKVFLQKVNPDSPVEGRFDFTSESGQHFVGNFTAAWGNQIVYCG